MSAALKGSYSDTHALVCRMQVGKHKEARKETESKLKKICERLDDAIEAEAYNQLAEELLVRATPHQRTHGYNCCIALGPNSLASFRTHQTLHMQHQM